MPNESVNICDKIFALYRVTSEQLTNFLKEGNFNGYGVKANEFDVFCAFWVTTCYLRSTPTPAIPDIENFSRSVIVSIIDRIVAGQDDDIDDEYVNSLGETITGVFVDRFSDYREFFQSDIGQGENGIQLSFPRLGEGFLTNVLDGPVSESSPIRHLLDDLLADLFEKSMRYFAG
ncbi:MAG: hypothetical protein V1706_10620 [Pseudomonadota bacterium]